MYCPEPFADIAFNYDRTLPYFLHKELKSIKKPYFISTLFPEIPIAICKPLPHPYDEFAISHHGTVFKYQPLITTKVRIGNTNFLTVDSTQVCHEDLKLNTPIVTITNKFNQRKTFPILRLFLQAFYQVPLSTKVVVTFGDNDPTNIHISNITFMEK